MTWLTNPNDNPINQKYYRQCGEYTICKFGGTYLLTSRSGANINIHCVRDSFKECAEYYDVNICKAD